MLTRRISQTTSSAPARCPTLVGQRSSRSRSFHTHSTVQPFSLPPHSLPPYSLVRSVPAILASLILLPCSSVNDPLILAHPMWLPRSSVNDPLVLAPSILTRPFSFRSRLFALAPPFFFVSQFSSVFAPSVHICPVCCIVFCLSNLM
jgi:hypothetical protein